MDKERKQIDLETALKLIPETDTIHTFRNNGGILVGADWKRENIVLRIKTNGVELAGETARSLSHGLASYDEANGWLFIQTK